MSRKYWWVNHNQTARWEIAGGYLWSPKTEARGAFSQFYENMRLAAPGDIVASYANGLVGNIGFVTESAQSAPKPDFGSAGSYWDTEGWRLPVKWSPVASPVKPRDHWEDLRDKLPSKYSPLNREGNGNQKAYLAEISRDLLERIAELCDFPLKYFDEPSLANDIESLLNVPKRQTGRH